MALTTIARVQPVRLMNVAQALGALDQADSLEPQIRLNWQLQYYIHRRRLLLLSPKADTHF